MKPRHGKNSNRFVSVRGYAGFLILLSVPVLLGAGKNDRGAVEANRQQIQNMSRGQQDKLKRNFAEFQKLSIQDKNVIRQLHQRLEEDSNKGGNLRELMWVYKEWLRTLSPWQREELLKQKDPVARLKLVRKIKQEQDYGELERTLSRTKREQWRKADDATRQKLIREFKRDPETMYRRSSSGYSPRAFRPPISTEEFDNVMNLVEENTEIADDVRAQFSGITKVQRHLLVLLAAMKQSQKQQRPQLEDQPKPQFLTTPPVIWPNDVLMKKLMVVLDGSDFQKRLRSSESAETRRRFLFFTICGSFRFEWRAELRNYSPSDEELQEFFKQLDQSDKEDLLRLSGSEPSLRLKSLYYNKQEAESKFHDEYSEFREILSRYHPFGGRGGRRSRSRGKGERGRSRGGAKGEFGPGNRSQFPPGNKGSRKGPPQG